MFDITQKGHDQEFNQQLSLEVKKNFEQSFGAPLPTQTSSTLAGYEARSEGLADLCSSLFDLCHFRVQYTATCTAMSPSQQVKKSTLG